MTQVEFERDLRVTHRCVEMVLIVSAATLLIVMRDREGKRQTFTMARQRDDLMTLFAAGHEVDDRFG